MDAELPKPVLVKTSKWEAPLAHFSDAEDTRTCEGALRSCLAACADVVKPYGMYFLEVTENVEPKGDGAFATLFDVYQVSIRVWERHHGDAVHL